MSADLRPADFVPVGGGTWSGLLFDNPRSGLAPRLTWTFDFRYRDVVRDYGETPVTLTLDWIPLSVPGWRGMAGQTWRGTGFTEGGEASVYYFMHHRFEHIELRIAEQAQDGAVYVAATVSGDIDGLGIDSPHAEAWLPFDGITVALSDARSPGDAWSRLTGVTDTTGLSPTPVLQPGSHRFVAAST